MMKTKPPKTQHVQRARRGLYLSLGAILLLASAALASSVGSYDLSWWTVDGGGGYSTGGSYALDGTAGQPDARTLSGGDYTLFGGFRNPTACYTLATAADPVAGGNVTADPAPNCASQYLEGTVVELTAVSQAGYVVDYWSGDASGSENPVRVTMDGDKSVTAHFRESDLPCYTLATAAEPATGGEVNANLAPNCVSQYEQGAAVTLTAEANTDYAFDNWSGDASGSVNPLGVMMDGDKSITAHFSNAQEFAIYLPLVLR